MLTTKKKNEVLEAVAEALIQNTEYLLLENHKDLERGIANQMNPGLVDRLRLTKERIAGMAEGIRQIVKLPDPVGEILDDYEAENGLHIVKKRVPMGVIGIIYESHHPNGCFRRWNQRKGRFSGAPWIPDHGALPGCSLLHRSRQL